MNTYKKKDTGIDIVVLYTWKQTHMYTHTYRFKEKLVTVMLWKAFISVRLHLSP